MLDFAKFVALMNLVMPGCSGSTKNFAKKASVIFRSERTTNFLSTTTGYVNRFVN